MSNIDQNPGGENSPISIYWSAEGSGNEVLRPPIKASDELNAELRKGLHAVLPSALKILNDAGKDRGWIQVQQKELLELFITKALAPSEGDVAAGKENVNAMNGYLAIRFKGSDPSSMKALVKLEFDASRALRFIQIDPEYEGSDEDCSIQNAQAFVNAVREALSKITSAIHGGQEQMRLLKLSNRKK